MTICFYVISLIALMYCSFIMIRNYQYDDLKYVDNDFFLEIVAVMLSIPALMYIAILLSIEIVFNLIK